eukprot:s4095_g5.t3
MFGKSCTSGALNLLHDLRIGPSRHLLKIFSADLSSRLHPLVKLQCRLVGHETDETLQRDLGWAKSQALRHVPKDVVDAVCKLAELCMQKASLERYAERKQPLVFLYNCTLGRPLHHSQRLSEESRAFVSQVLQPLLEAPERAQGVWKVCLHTAWLEQNMRDWDGAQGGHITGASNGYKVSMDDDARVIEENIPRMGFDFDR